MHSKIASKFIILVISIFVGNCSWDKNAIDTAWLISNHSEIKIPNYDFISYNWRKSKLPKVIGFDQSSLWLRTIIPADASGLSSTTKLYYLINPVSFIEEIYLYEVILDNKNNDKNLKDFKIVSHQTAGSIIPVERKYYSKFPYPIFQIEVSPKLDTYIFLSYKSESSLYIEPILFDEEAIQEAVSGLQLHLIIFFTILGIIFLFNFSQYFYTRNTTYLFYIFHITAVTLYQLAYTGLGRIYFWNQYLEWNRRSLVVLGSLSFIALILFSKRFLSLPTRSFRLNAFSNVFIFFLSLNLLMGFFLPVSISDPLTHIISLITCIFLFMACMRIFVLGITIVKFYLVGLITLLASIFLFNLFAFGIIEWNFLRHSIEFGTLVELFIFNFAIWARIHSIQNIEEPKNSDSINEIKFVSKSFSRIENIDSSKVFRDLDILMKEKIFCDEDLTLARLASFLEIRPDQLSALLNKQMKMNFNEYINQIRILEVKKEIDLGTNRKILDIAFSAGFNSKSSFNKVFRDVVGLTPTEYRNQTKRQHL